ncbi:prephenate dehydrogenase [Wielerella bovis]|uniref:prephenate dehydrogenase n=1 Tax=Wielerella bovis TaxID=2917790 RepID=UPI00201944F1|nr:prephenate dehydrogenase/arogenate dehydrogenase family protein [Wielerella bovis]ULJ64564.1 prephenate dehydrogenase/arogenate dehydrogenase family protein [Wielerella bovis]ULJ66853.1 prephenate dehydrogenase/arogenate dehydrogenase family protein [Wielerella bovis]
MTIKQITLIGVGLIGGSFVLDLKRHKRVQTVVGIDLDRTNLDRALERRVIDVAYTQICAEAVQHADLVLIATPVATLPNICTALAPLLSEHTIVSDVGSTKQSTLAAFRLHLPQQFAHCVAAHPIAGSDRSGALAAQFGLYQDKKLILCPNEQQNAGSLKTIETLWQAVGAHTHIMSAHEHDEIFAAVSHLPHLLAFAYVHQMLDHPKGTHYLDFAGSGFRDFTRIAASSPEMWKDIMLANKNSLLDLISAQKQQLDYLADSLKNNDADALIHYFQAAQKVREEWGDKH